MLAHYGVGKGAEGNNLRLDYSLNYAWKSVTCFRAYVAGILPPTHLVWDGLTQIVWTVSQ
jgi:hypothetical protein